MKLLNYLKEVRQELTFVKFPTKSQLINYTLLVIVFSLILSVYLGGVDLGLKELIARFLNKYL